MDRDHFMDEFFEQVTDTTMPPDPKHGPQPTILFSPSPPLLLFGILPVSLGLAHFPESLLSPLEALVRPKDLAGYSQFAAPGGRDPGLH